MYVHESQPARKKKITSVTVISQIRTARMFLLKLPGGAALRSAQIVNKRLKNLSSDI